MKGLFKRSLILVLVTTFFGFPIPGWGISEEGKKLLDELRNRIRKTQEQQELKLKTTESQIESQIATLPPEIKPTNTELQPTSTPPETAKNIQADSYEEDSLTNEEKNDKKIIKVYKDHPSSSQSHDEKPQEKFEVKQNQQHTPKKKDISSSVVTNNNQLKNYSSDFRLFGEVSDEDLILFAMEHIWPPEKANKHRPPWTPPSKPKKINSNKSNPSKDNKDNKEIKSSKKETKTKQTPDTSAKKKRKKK